MKKVIAIMLVILMSLQCFYKLGVITYFQLNREFIAEVLCINKEKPITMCYGQCFLNKNLDLADDSDSNTSSVPAGKQKVDFPTFLISEIHYQFGKDLKRNRPNCVHLDDSSSKHSSVPFHPPALLS